MSAKRYKIGVIGAGGIASQVHVPAWQALPDVDVVGIVDMKEGRAAEVAKKAGIANAFTDYRDLLAVDGLDAVSVCTPNVFHAEHTMAALDAGLNVLCEKPMSVKVEDALRMAETAKRTGKLLMVGMTSRFQQITETLHRYVAEGLFGDLYYLKAGWLRRSGIPGYGSWFTNKDLAGGGCLLDIGVHYLDLAMWIAGFPKPVSVSGSTFAKFGPRGLALGGWGSDIYRDGPQRFDVDDLAAAFIRLENGAVLTLEVSWAAHIGEQGEHYLKFLGTEGGAEMSHRFPEHSTLRLYSLRDGQQCDTMVDVPATKQPHWHEIAHFLACVKGEQQPRVTLDEALTIQRILNGLYTSAESGHEVAI